MFQKGLGPCIVLFQKGLGPILANLTADTLIVGDSMVRTLQPFKLSKLRKVRCKTLSGARVEEVFETTKSLANAFHVSELILHVGTNNVATCENSLIEKQIESLCDQVLADCPSVTSITISSIIQRKIFQNDLREKTIELNKLLRALTQRRGWGFIDNSSIDPSTHLEMMEYIST